MAKGKNAGPEMLRRFSARDIMGEAIKNLVSEDGAVDLFTIFGVANGTVTKESNFGESTAVVGQFEATRLNDGLILRSTKAYLPEPVGSALIEAVNKLQANDAGVRFGGIVGIKPSKKSALGYEYTWRQLVKPEEKAALDDMREQVKGLLTG